MIRQIVVITNSEKDKNSIAGALAPEGYAILNAYDSLSGMELLSKGIPDAVLVDIELPGLDLAEFISTVKRNAPETALLIITGYSTIQSIRDMNCVGVSDFIFKPLNGEELCRVLGSAIEHSIVSRENARLKETLAIFQAGEAMNSGLKKESLYRIIVESVLSQTKSSLGALVIYNDERNRLEIPYCSYIGGGNLHFPRDYMSFPAVDYVLGNNKPLLLVKSKKGRVTTKIECREYSQGIFPEILPFECEMLLYPMSTPQSQTIGMIVISKKTGEPAFSRKEIELMGVIIRQSSVSVHNSFLVEGLERNYVNTLVSLNAILEAKHPYTKGHTQRVTRYSTTVARELGLSTDEIQIMRDGAMLHDIGKIGVSDSILNKPGSLDDDEFDIVRKHPIIGETIIKPIRFLENALPIIRHHHERMDGRGWPDGLSGTQIPLLVRICTLADACDAMSSSRSYRDSMPLDEIRRELIMHTGTQFDEQLVDIFLRLMDRGKIDLTDDLAQPILLTI